jgi:hypothetical protein
MMQGKVLDLTVMVNMVAAISVCVAITLWLFAVARFLWSSEKRDQAAVLSLSAFAAQLMLIVIAAAVGSHGFGQLVTVLALGTAAVLSVLNIAWAFRCSSVIGSRMRPATLLWVAGIIMAISTPQY